MTKNAQTQNRIRSLISIVCPVHNEQDCIPLFFERLKAAIEDLWDSYDFELIFTNNASSDNSLDRILEIREAHSWVHVITLSRNFGYQRSVMCGLEHANGDACIIIDVDCEDPPELIPEFIVGWEAGNDLVYGQRMQRPEPLHLQFLRKIFYRITKRIADSEFILYMAEFSLFSRNIRDIILSNRSTSPFVRNEIAYAGFRRLAIPYSRQNRASGRTHYNIFRMFLFAVEGMLTSSTFPLRLLIYLGLPLGFLDFVGFIYFSINESLTGVIPLLLLNFMFFTYSAISIGLYVARIYKDVIHRPLFILDEKNSYFNSNPDRKIDS